MIHQPAPLRVLLIEDEPDDAELLVHALRREGYDLVHRRVDHERDLSLALVEEEWDLAFCDWVMPAFGALAALEVVKSTGRDIPVVIVSGTVDEETAVSALRAGARDFLVKDNLVRLGPIVARELAESADRRRRQDAERALRSREAILTAVGSAAERLIRAASWEEAVQEVLARTGPVTGANRVLVYQNRARLEGREGILRLTWRADSEHTEATEDLDRIRWSEVAPAWDLAVAGGGVAFAVGDERFQAPAWRWMARHNVRTVCLVPIRTGTVWWGAIAAVNRDVRAWSNGEISALRVLADALGASIERSELHAALKRSNSELVEAYNRTLEGWALALELRDRGTAGHTRRTTEMTVRLAEAMGIEGEALTHIHRGALLHDIGKMGVPDSILQKPGALTDAERDVMQRHPVYAHELLLGIPYLHPALDIPFAHHERWDGTGYPRGLAGEEIPIAARIFAVVDAWDAMRSDRPYRSARRPEEAMAEIEAGSGTHFDPAVVETFLRMIRDRSFRGSTDTGVQTTSRT